MRRLIFFLLAGLVAVVGCGTTSKETTPPVVQSTSPVAPPSETSAQPSRPPISASPAASDSATPAATNESPTVTEVDSSNWAGYVSNEGAPFASVEGRFVVPSLKCGPADKDKAFSVWVGFDGFGGDAVEQAGVSAQCDGVSGAGHPAIDGVLYEAWYMMFDAGEEGVFDLLIRPGDVVFSRVRMVGDKYELLVRNETLGQERSSLQPCKRSELVRGECERVSAEWIVERPGMTQLLDFKPVRLYDNRATTVTGEVVTPAQVSSSRVNMVQDELLAETGEVLPDGSFEVSFVASGRTG